jgi:hypothetical protein
LTLLVVPCISLTYQFITTRGSIMKKNMGSADRVLRTAAAALLAVLMLTGQISGVIGTIAGIFAVVFLATSMVSFCPLYLPLKISTGTKPTSRGTV